MLISPTEPPSLRALGETSSMVESFGCDYLFFTPLGMVGVQRKEISDLVASVRDGRLTREIALMGQLVIKVLLIEGEPKWNQDGELLSLHSSWTLSQHQGLVWSLQLNGFWIGSVPTIASTALYLSQFEKWLSKDRHDGLITRPKPNSNYGLRSKRDFSLHILQSFDGIGPGVAGNIYDAFGRVPLEWSVSEDELVGRVHGLGKGRVRKMFDALKGE